MAAEQITPNQAVLNSGNYGLVISCEHGGNRIPGKYKRLFYDYQALLDSHRGFDLGALTMAKALALTFSAPLASSTVSRLLVDLNRSPTHRKLHLYIVGQLPAAERNRILAHYYEPYRAEVEQLVKQTIASRGLAIHLSSHSFTPELDGKRRNADVGLLYDPARPGETVLCEHWQQSLKSCMPSLKVRRNYPYAGKVDGLTRTLRQKLPATTYLGVELEINQKHVLMGGQHWVYLRKTIIGSLRQTLAGLYS
jgi:predicted N-formylglutamate amidohydrolase